MNRFVRLRGGKMLEVTKQTDKMLVGFRVNREGERVERVTAKHVETFLDVTTPDQITAELRMDLKYGTLEPVGETK